MNPPSFHNRIRKVCALAAATLILPALAYAQNNQGQNDQGTGINLGVPNGTYAFQESGNVPAIPPATGLVPLQVAGQETFFANGTITGLVSFSHGGSIFSRVPFTGFFTVNGDGSVLLTHTLQGQFFGLGVTSHFNAYPTPDGNTMTFVGTDPETIVSGFFTRGRYETLR